MSSDKLISGRQYKNDISDIAGILLEHQKRGIPLTIDVIYAAVTKLYGKSAEIPIKMKRWLEKTIANGDYETVYSESRAGEQDAKAIVLEFEEHYPGELRGENINAIIEAAKRKREAATNKDHCL